MKIKTLIRGLIVAIILFGGSGYTIAQTEITFWTTEVGENKMEIQESLVAQFQTKNPDITVKIIPVSESELPEKVKVAKLTKKLPDVIFHSLNYAIGWAKEGILDPQAASGVIEDLEKETFFPGPLNLIRYKEDFAAVPIDGWGQLLIYRKDLLDEKGLAVPEDWESIKVAAQSVHNPPLLWGFEVATDPEDIYTQQVIEGFALSNNARLIDPRTGEVNLNTPQFVATLRLYKNLSKFTPAGNLHWLHTRLDYFTGRCAMTMWPSFILDELAGLEAEQKVLVKNLHKKTGFVTLIKGPEGAAQYGEVSYLGITTTAKVEAAKKWVKFLLSEEYLSWLSMAAEGKFPVRRGTKEKPNKFIEEWRELNFGEGKVKISEYYEPGVINSILAGVERFDRWGFAAGKGELITKIYRTRVIPKVLKRYLDGEIFTAEATASLINDLVRGF